MPYEHQTGGGAEREVSKRHRLQVEDLASLLVYILGHRPDEFGLVPDREGYVPVKRVLQAVREEPGWGHIREGHLREVLLGPGRGLLETEGKAVRAGERRYTLEGPVLAPPGGLLFTPIRRRAHPHVAEKGLSPRPGPFHALTLDRDMALRMGRRLEKDPVILEIKASGPGAAPLVLWTLGKLYLTPEVPPGAVAGPAVSKEAEAQRPDQEKRKKKKEKPSRPPDFRPGTFVLESDRDPAVHRQEKKGRKPRTWKEKARKTRRGP